MERDYEDNIFKEYKDIKSADATKFRNYYDDIQDNLSKMTKLMDKQEFCQTLKKLKFLEVERLKRPDSDQIYELTKNVKESIINHSEYPRYYIYKVVFNIVEYQDLTEAVNSAEDKYFKDVSAENRYKFSRSTKYYAEMDGFGHDDIIKEADDINKELKGKNKTITDSKILKRNIELYFDLCKANENRSWFSKAWSNVKGFFGGRTEDKALAEMKENIIKTSAFSEELMGIAFTVGNSSHLDQVLKVASINYKESVDSKKLGNDKKRVDISNKEVGEDIKLDGITNGDGLSNSLDNSRVEYAKGNEDPDESIVFDD